MSLINQVLFSFIKIKKTLSRIVKKRKEKPKKEGEIDPKFWDMMLCAKKSDFERICHEFGVTDFRWMLKQLNLKKKEKEDEQAKVFVSNIIISCWCLTRFVSQFLIILS